MKQGTQLGEFDIAGLRARLRAMSDAELLLFGQVAKNHCNQETLFGKPPLEVYVIQLREARKEWRRRHRKLPLRDSI
jgi:hypothetical protein